MVPHIKLQFAKQRFNPCIVQFCALDKAQSPADPAPARASAACVASYPYMPFRATPADPLGSIPPPDHPRRRVCLLLEHCPPPGTSRGRWAPAGQETDRLSLSPSARATSPSQPALVVDASLVGAMSHGPAAHPDLPGAHMFTIFHQDSFGQHHLTCLGACRDTSVWVVCYTICCRGVCRQTTMGGMLSRNVRGFPTGS